MTSAATEVKTPTDPLRHGLDYLASVQKTDGAWEGEVVWNTMLLAQYIMVRTAVAEPGDSAFDQASRRKMIRYFEVSEARDGGWGMHSESPPYVFFTTLAYVALRLLGVRADEPLAARARAFLRSEPGRVLSIPSWGKFWLAVLGLGSYQGVNPIPPELFLLPERLPVHPNRYYCHTRYIYLAISYLYGRRFSADLGPIKNELREELYGQPFGSIDFREHRHHLAPSDVTVRPTRLLRLGYDLLYAYEGRHSPTLRGRALAFCLERILYEMRASRYQALSPVNGLLSCLAIHASDPHHPELARCIAGLEAWRWEDEDKGIRYAGARSNAWDTAFVLRAALEAPEPWRQRQPMLEGYGFLRNTQMKEELEGRERERRDPVLGGFCFSDGAHRWPVSDCTAEALSAILEMHADPALAPSSALRIADGLIQKAITFVLARQNQDGGFGTYERRRAGSFLEALNPSEMFGQCMTERSYVECTASCVSALARARTARTEEGSPLLSRAIMGKVESSIRRAIHFLGSQQRPDGSWAGFWGIHFTYAIFHVVEAFHAAGRRSADPTLRRAVKWLLSKQKADGGWGEHYTSAMTGHYVEHSESQASNTAWALLALLGAGEAPASAPVMRAVRWLGSKQLSDGSWPTQAPAGVFFGTAVLDYTLYKNYFPTWALARHTKLCERP